MSDMFPQHPRSGDWETLKGRMLPPPELPYSEQDKNYEAQVDTSSMTESWTSHVIVQTPLTHGSGTGTK